TEQNVAGARTETLEYKQRLKHDQNQKQSSGGRPGGHPEQAQSSGGRRRRPGEPSEAEAKTWRTLRGRSEDLANPQRQKQSLANPQRQKRRPGEPSEAEAKTWRTLRGRSEDLANP
ncbi:hypothetical protein CRENBAI_017760, partial [Crenichthys baileyi]